MYQSLTYSLKHVLSFSGGTSSSETIQHRYTGSGFPPCISQCRLYWSLRGMHEETHYDHLYLCCMKMNEHTSESRSITYFFQDDWQVQWYHPTWRNDPSFFLRLLVKDEEGNEQKKKKKNSRSPVQAPTRTHLNVRAQHLYASLSVLLSRWRIQTV